MATLPVDAVRKLPWWAPLAGSAIIAFHLFSVLMFSLAAQSGPWPLPGFAGIDMVTGPEFASTVNNIVHPVYLQPLGMTHNYHFLSDQTAQDGVSFEVLLKDENGVVFKKLKFPEESANFWVKHRQMLLAKQLLSDTSVPQRGPEKVSSKGVQVPMTDYWLSEMAINQLITPAKDKDGNFLPPLVTHPELQAELKKKLEIIQTLSLPDSDSPLKAILPGKDGPAPAATPVNPVEGMARISLPGNLELPPGAAQSRPSPWELILAKSYMRYLCAKHGAHSAELIRQSQLAILPPYAIMSEPPQGTFTKMMVHYGDLKRDFKEVQK